jgi:hypothetical protein
MDLRPAVICGFARRNGVSNARLPGAKKSIRGPVEVHEFSAVCGQEAANDDRRREEAMKTKKKKKQNGHLLSNSIEHMKRAARRHTARFAEGRAAHAALAPFTDAEAVEEALGPNSKLSDDDRGIILAAMVIEHQRTGMPLWAGLLAGAFQGALVRLRTRLGSEPDADHDQRVICAFVEAISSPFVAASGRFANVSIIRTTQKVVFGEAQAELDARDTNIFERFEDETFVPAPALPIEAPVEDALAAEMRRAFAAVGDPEEVGDMLHATYVVGESLADWVERSHPELDAPARTALYERLRRKRLEAVHRLRASERFRALADKPRRKSSAA